MEEKQVASLSDLFVRYRTDKQYSQHNYALFYEMLFTPLREKIKNFMEIGIGSITPTTESNMCFQPHYTPGASLRAWRDFFPQAEIVGVDIDPSTTIENEPRIKTFVCDSTNPMSVSALQTTSQWSPEQFDIIIDDGWHDPVAQQRTLLNFWPFVKKGGVYNIEDISWNQKDLSSIVHGHRCICREVQKLLDTSESFVILTRPVENSQAMNHHDSVLKVIPKPL
jgi:hypothetical protein